MAKKDFSVNVPQSIRFLFIPANFERLKFFNEADTPPANYTRQKAFNFYKAKRMLNICMGDLYVFLSDVFDKTWNSEELQGSFKEFKELKFAEGDKSFVNIHMDNETLFTSLINKMYLQWSYHCNKKKYYVSFGCCIDEDSDNVIRLYYYLAPEKNGNQKYDWTYNEGAMPDKGWYLDEDHCEFYTEDYISFKDENTIDVSELHQQAQNALDAIKVFIARQ